MKPMKNSKMTQDYTTLLGMNDGRTHKKYVQLTSQCLNVVEASSDVLNTKLWLKTLLNENEEKKHTFAQRMVVTLEEDKKAEKRAIAAAGESVAQALVSNQDSNLAASSCRLELETQQVADDAIYIGASDDVTNVSNNKTIPYNTYLMSKSDSKNYIERKHIFPLKTDFSVPS